MHNWEMIYQFYQLHRYTMFPYVKEWLIKQDIHYPWSNLFWDLPTTTYAHISQLLKFNYGTFTCNARIFTMSSKTSPPHFATFYANAFAT